MKRTLTLLGLMPITLTALMAQGQPTDVIADFEDKAVGTAIATFSLDGTATATARTEAAPGGRSGQAAHITTTVAAKTSGLNIRMATLPEGRVLGDYRP